MIWLAPNGEAQARNGEARNGEARYGEHKSREDLREQPLRAHDAMRAKYGVTQG